MSELLNFLIRIAMKVLLFSLIPPQPTAPFEKEGCVLPGEQTTRRKGKKKKKSALFSKPPKGRRFHFAQ